MKKIMVLTMVLVFAGTVKGAISVFPNDMSLAPAQSSQVVGIGIQNDDGSISFLYIGNASIGPQRAYMDGNIFSLFPETTTIAGLMLVGLQARRRKAL
jgi:hypothetical protein